MNIKLSYIPTYYMESTTNINCIEREIKDNNMCKIPITSSQLYKYDFLLVRLL